MRALHKSHMKTVKGKDLGGRVRRLARQKQPMVRAGQIEASSNRAEFDLISITTKCDPPTSSVASNLLNALSDLDAYVEFVPPPSKESIVTSSKACGISDDMKASKADTGTGSSDALRSLAEFVIKSREEETSRKSGLHGCADEDIDRLSQRVKEQANIVALLQRAQQQYAPEEALVAANLQARIEKMQGVVRTLNNAAQVFTPTPQTQNLAQSVSAMQTLQDGQSIGAPPGLGSEQNQANWPVGAFSAANFPVSWTSECPSIGSIDHVMGTCRPCAFFHKYEGGCSQGAQCTFCHLCNTTDVRMKQKEKRIEQQSAKNHAQWQLYHDFRERNVALRNSCFGADASLTSIHHPQPVGPLAF